MQKNLLKCLSLILIITGAGVQAEDSPWRDGFFKTPAASEWSDIFAYPGVEGTVRAMAVNGSALYIGGAVFQVDGLETGIARWDGYVWTAVGETNGEVRALCFWNGSLYAGGEFSTINGLNANHLARWDGTEWHDVGSGVTGSVHDIAAGPDGIYVAGDFAQAGECAVGNIARWDGSRWHDVGGGSDKRIYALVCDGDLVYAGGVFTVIGGVTAGGVAVWDGSAWSPLGSGVSTGRYYGPVVYDLAIMETDLYAAGDFDAAGGIPAAGVARWNGSAWSSLDSGIQMTPYGHEAVMSLLVDGTDLYAGGRFESAGGVPAYCIARWDETGWSALEGGVANDIKKVHMAEPDPQILAMVKMGSFLYAGGFYTDAGSVDANSIARWDGSAWHPVTNVNGMGHFVFASISDTNDIYVGGRFTTAGNGVIDRVARWNGSVWLPMNGGVGGGDVRAMAVGSDGIYVGGSITEAGGISVNGIARWDGTRWHALDAGIRGGERPMVYVIAADGGDVYVGGDFTTAGGIGAANIARWDGSAWHALGTGTDDDVLALAVHDGILYCGGHFTTAGGVDAAGIAMWDGSWQCLGSGISGTYWREYHADQQKGAFVADIEFIGDALFAGGYFRSAGGLGVNNIARWENGGWHDVGGGVSGKSPAPDVNEEQYAVIQDMAVMGTDLYAGGWFGSAGGVAAARVAKWDGTGWSALGSGMGGSVSDFTTMYLGRVMTMCVQGDRLYLGGEFKTAGGHSSHYFALWNTASAEPPPVTDYPDFTAVSSGPVVSDGGSSMGCAWGDFNNDGYTDLFIANDDGECNFLYQNTGGGTFVKINSGPVVSDGGNSWAGTWGDYDNDGDADLYVANVGSANFLYRNNGAGAFERIGDPVTDAHASQGCCWCDYNNDGYLDLFVANGDDENNDLYTNQGDGTLIKEISGPVVTTGGNSVQGSWADYDNDGDMDLFVANKNGQNNFLFENNGSGGFVQMISGDIVTDGGESWSGSWGDYDNDGDMDLFVANNGEANFLYENNGDGTFIKNMSATMVLESSHTRGSCWGDINNDGRLDLLVTSRNEPGNLYMNRGNGAFDQYHTEAANARGAALCDYNRDGDLDVCTVINHGNNFLYENIPEHYYHWIQVRLTGTTSNKAGIGARIMASAAVSGVDVRQFRQISGQTGFGGQNASSACFGFRNTGVIDTLRIYWPSGTVWDTTHVAVDQVLTIREPGDTGMPVLPGSPPARFALYGNFPNPFNPETRIRYDLPVAEKVILEIFDLRGHRIATLVDGWKNAGSYQVTFHARFLPGGTYLYRIRTGSFQAVRKMVLLK